MRAEKREILTTPKDPTSTVKSRREHCYGFAVVAYIEQNFTDVNNFLMGVRDNIIRIVDPERRPENCPRKLPGLIKTKSLHASFYGSAPFVHQSDYADFFKSATGLDDGRFLETVREKLAQYLNEQEPRLVPVRLEFKEEDGTILARYRVVTKDNDPRPLVSLKQLLDAGTLSHAPTWDPNPLRDTTVAIVLCVAAVQEDLEKIEAISAVLSLANDTFQSLGEKFIEKYSVIKGYDKRTLTREKHAEIFCEIDKTYSASSLEVTPHVIPSAARDLLSCGTIFKESIDTSRSILGSMY